MGLEIKPDHNGINEYLGELYVVTNRIDLANTNCIAAVRSQILRSLNIRYK